MKTYYAAITAKDADAAVAALTQLEQDYQAEEVEVRQIIQFGQKALVIFVRYDQGTIR